VRPFRSGSLGFSLSGNRFEVALVGRYRLLVSLRPILKCWEAILSPVVLAAPIPAGDVSVGSTPRSLYCPEAIGECGGIVQAICAEHAGALTMAVRPFLAAQALEGDSLCGRSKAVTRGSCTCGRSVMGDRSIWSQRAEPVPITVAIDALAGRIVLGDASEVERSPTGPHAQSWQLGASQAVQMRPLGQGGRLGSAGERRARPSARAVGMVSETKSREAHSRCGEGSTALLLGACRWLKRSFRWAGNVTVSPVYRRPVTSWRCIRSGTSHVRLAWAWERSRTRVGGRGVADVRSGPPRVPRGGLRRRCV
jgi:hypothetical protein